MNGDTPMIRPAAGSHLEQAAALAASRTATPARAPEVKREAPRSNVLADDAHRAALADALGAVARIVGRTLGPHGSNALVRD